jgi:hypothetical protein
MVCWYFSGNLHDESDVLDWMVKQKTDMSIEEVNREKLGQYIETKEFLAVVFCKFIFITKSNENFNLNVT